MSTCLKDELVSAVVLLCCKWRRVGLCAFTACFMMLPHLAAAAPVSSIDAIGEFSADYAKILDAVIVRQNYKSAAGQFDHNAVDYKILTGDSKLRILREKILAQLAAMPLPAATVAELGFWIDAYNFFTLNAVATAYPIKSMKQLGWKQKTNVVGGRHFSLNEIEHELTRPLGDARTHFALNCASVSCPSLWHKPYSSRSVGSTLPDILDNRVTAALRSPIHLRKQKGGLFSGEKIAISKIFKWYKGDFNTAQTTTQSFIKRYVPVALAEELAHLGMSSLAYEWNLNTVDNISAYFAELAQQNPNNVVRLLDQP